MAKFDELRKKYNKMFEEEAKKHGVTPYKPQQNSGRTGQFEHIRQQLSQQRIEEMNKPKEVSAPTTGAPSVSSESDGFFSKAKDFISDTASDAKDLVWNDTDGDGSKIDNVFGNLLNGGKRAISQQINAPTFNVLDNIIDKLPGDKWKNTQIGVPFSPGLSISPNDIVNSQKKTDNKVQTGLDFINEMAGYTVPYAGIYKGLGALGKAAQGTKAAQKFNSMKPISQNALRGLGASTVFAGADAGLTETFAPDERDWKDHALRAGTEMALGTAFDAAAPYIGKGLGKLFDRNKRATPPPNTPYGPHQANPTPYGPNPMQQLPPGQGLLNPGAMQRRLKYDSPAPQQMDEVLELPPYNMKEFDQAVNEQYQLLKSQMGQGVEPGNVIRNELGEVIDRYGRISNNPRWYREFYAQNGRKPTNQELKQLAEQHVLEGYQDDMGFIPAWRQNANPEIDDEVLAIQQMIDKLKKTDELPSMSREDFFNNHVFHGTTSTGSKAIDEAGLIDRGYVVQGDYNLARKYSSSKDSYISNTHSNDGAVYYSSQPMREGWELENDGFISSPYMEVNNIVPIKPDGKIPASVEDPYLYLVQQRNQKEIEGLEKVLNTLRNNNSKVDDVIVPESQLKTTQYNPVVEEPTPKFTTKAEPMNATRAEYRKPFVNDKLLDSLQYGDKIRIRKDRGEVELDFVTRNGNNVVAKRKSGKEVVVPAELVVGKVSPTKGVENLINSLKNTNSQANADDFNPLLRMNLGPNAPKKSNSVKQAEQTKQNENPKKNEQAAPQEEEVVQKPKTKAERKKTESDYRKTEQEYRQKAKQLKEAIRKHGKDSEQAKQLEEETFLLKMNLQHFAEQLELELPADIRQEVSKVFTQDVNVENLKDLSGFTAYTRDLYRNFRDVFGDKFQSVKSRLLDPFDRAKKANITDQEKWADDLKREIVDKLGIKKGSKESKLVQDYGEKTITLDELKQQAPDKWQDIIKADEWFRKAYKQWIKDVNKVRAKIYPNQPDKLVPERENYYRHFRELNGLEGLKNLFDTPAGIDPSLVATSEFTQPNSKFASFMQKRGLGPYKSDAVGGFLDYLPSASYAKHIDPFIPKFKQLAKELEQGTEKSKNMNNFIGYLRKYSQDLAGKTNFIDRPLQDMFGRTTFGVIHWLNNRVKLNVILGNVGSAVAQLANIPNGIAFAKQHAVKGAGQSLKDAATMQLNDAAKQSGFLKERFGAKIYRQFDERIIDQPKRFAGWMIETADKIGTTFIWNSAYAKGLSEGVQNPIQYADDMTRNLVAGRGIGEVPLAQKSKLVQLLAPFQLEVANLWRVQGDFLRNKDVGAILTLFVGSYLFNKGTEAARGSAVTFDPIDAAIDAFTEEDLSVLERGGRLAGEVLSNLPFGQSLANFYPEYGTEHLPTREQLFGDRDPNRFGSGLLVAKGIQDPIYKLALPFGGNQIKKAKEGIGAIMNEGVYNDDKTKLKYPVEDNVVNRVKAALFGPGSFGEAREYYDNDLRPLSEKQTKEYEAAKERGTGEQTYNNLQLQREISGIERMISKIRKDSSLTNVEKQMEIAELLERMRSLQTTR